MKTVWQLLNTAHSLGAETTSARFSYNRLEDVTSGRIENLSLAIPVISTPMDAFKHVGYAPIINIAILTVTTFAVAFLVANLVLHFVHC